jgi:hypothetical protein
MNISSAAGLIYARDRKIVKLVTGVPSVTSYVTQVSATN